MEVELVFVVVKKITSTFVIHQTGADRPGGDILSCEEMRLSQSLSDHKSPEEIFTCLIICDEASSVGGGSQEILKYQAHASLCSLGQVEDTLNGIISIAYMYVDEEILYLSITDKDG